MTKADTAKLISKIVMAYPNFDKFKDEGHIKAMTNLWADMFIDDDTGIVEMAVKKHISISRWPPSIAEIREIMVDIQHPGIIPPDEAWVAVKNTLYSVDEFCYTDLSLYLPPLVLEAVNAIGYSTLYEQYRQHTGYDRVAFKDIYEPMYRREREKAMLPKSLRQGIENANQILADGVRHKLLAATGAKKKKQDLYEGLVHKSFSPKLEEAQQKLIMGDNDYE